MKNNFNINRTVLPTAPSPTTQHLTFVLAVIQSTGNTTIAGIYTKKDAKKSK